MLVYYSRCYPAFGCRAPIKRMYVCMYLLSSGVHLSVCPSVTLVHCIHTAEDIVKLLSRPGSLIILFFDPQRRYPVPRGTPSSGAQNTRGVKILRFSTIPVMRDSTITNRLRLVSLGNGTRLAHGYYGTLIGSHMRSIQW